MAKVLSVSPEGRLFVDDIDGARPDEDAASLDRSAVLEGLRAAFDESPSRGLFQLAAAERQTDFEPTFVFWRDFAHRYLTRLCQTPGLETDPHLAVEEPGAAELTTLVEQAPPMRGLEYLSEKKLRALWTDFDAFVRKEMSVAAGGPQVFLRGIDPLLHLVGRVCFHLAENKDDEEFPFAFLATYTSRLSERAKLQHVPLGRALKEYAGKRNLNALISLLSPVQRAAERSRVAKKLADSGDVFHPQAWTPAEAFAFLKDIPIYEESGIVVRVPDWWKAGRPASPRVSVTIGDKKNAGLGLDTLLDFSVQFTLDGEELTAEEKNSILASASGLVLLRGKWVEIDGKKLSQVLDHWKSVEKEAAAGGISFIKGMRLISGAGVERDDALPADDGEDQWFGVGAGEWLQKLLADFKDPAGLEDRRPGKALRTTLRPYQQEGVNWLWFMHRLGLGTCLADDMGLGKTIQVLALLLLIKRERKKTAPGLLVVPASLVANWKSEIKRFAPSLSVIFLHPSERAPEAMKAAARDPARVFKGADLVVTSYGMLSRLAWLADCDWGPTILDEAQAIKNPSTRQTRAVKKLRGGPRIVLTGTPVENSLLDLWSIFDFICPGLLGPAAVFARFAKRLAARERNRYGPLRTLVRPYILRRMKTDRTIIDDLPEKTEMKVFCSLSKKQAVLYEHSVADLAKKLVTADGIERRGIVLAFIMRFKQICNHPSHWLGDGGFAPGESGKFLRLRELCEEIASRQERLLLFTQFKVLTEPLAAFLEEIFRRPGLILHGGTVVKKRRLLVAEFQRDGGPPFFILSLKAGGTGLNLTAASHVMHFDRWWNPAVEDQATDRAFRIGQKKNVLVHKFVCRGTVEEKIDAMIEEKTGMARDLLEGGAQKMLTEMSDKELLKFVSFDIRTAMGD